jgi:hypothetical protein
MLIVDIGRIPYDEGIYPESAVSSSTISVPEFKHSLEIKEKS